MTPVFLMPTEPELPDLLAGISAGDRAAMDRAFAAVYAELRRLAHRQLGRNPDHGTLSTTALVHEAYLRLVDSKGAAVAGREHFFALAARAMRHVLIDYARRRKAVKRGGGEPITLLDEENVPAAERAAELLAIDDALTRLEAAEAPLGRLVELRFYGGLSLEETAGVLAVSASTVKREWRRARAFLQRELEAGAALA